MACCGIDCTGKVMSWLLNEGEATTDESLYGPSSKKEAPPATRQAASSPFTVDSRFWLALFFF